MTLKMEIAKRSWRRTVPLRITGKTFYDTEAVEVRLYHDGHVGEGEAEGTFYIGETQDSIVSQLEEVRPIVEDGMDRERLLDLLPPSGARNAIDSALWDLESKLTGNSVWRLADVKSSSVETVFTIGIENTPDQMAQRAGFARQYPLLKVKLDGNQPVERMEAIRKARPDARLVVDANQGFSFSQLKEIIPKFETLGIEMIEQPLPRNDDECLLGFESPIPLCADESCLGLSELAKALELYDMINIKLDKCGGLTEALMMVEVIKSAGKKIMVGNMGGTSLAMAPGFVVAQFCEFVDLDGPLAFDEDPYAHLSYERARIEPRKGQSWGNIGE